MKISGEDLRTELKKALIKTDDAYKRLNISRQTLFTRFNDLELDYDFILKVKRLLNIDLESIKHGQKVRNGEATVNTELSVGFSDINLPGDKEVYDKNSTLERGTGPPIQITNELIKSSQITAVKNGQTLSLTIKIDIIL